MKFVSAPDSGAKWFDAADWTVQMAVLAAVALFLAVFALRFFLGQRRRKNLAAVHLEVPNLASSSCHWKRCERSANSLERWHCRKCGVDAFSSTGKPPQECKRQLKETLL
jgi:ribosomal protein L37AE/L43A